MFLIKFLVRRLSPRHPVKEVCQERFCTEAGSHPSSRYAGAELHFATAGFRASDWVSQAQSNVMSAIAGEGWFTDSRNDQAMLFGNFPLWAQTLARTLPLEALRDQV